MTERRFTATEFIAVKAAYPNEAQAHTAALRLLEAHLIASGQVVKIESSYWWEGEIHREPEYELTCYTRGILFPDVEQVIKADHPYDVAQILATPAVDISTDFATWIREYTSQDQHHDDRRVVRVALPDPGSPAKATGAVRDAASSDGNDPKREATK